MTTVLRSENYRLSRGTEVWGMGIALIALQVAICIGCFAMTHLAIFHSVKDMVECFFGSSTFFEGFADTVSATQFRLLFIIMVASLVTKLYNTGVMKQLVSSGIKRRNIVLGQFISLTAVFTVLAMVLAVVQAFGRVVNGGSFGFASANLPRVALSIFGMFLVVASLVAMYQFIAHLTGSFGPTIAAGLALQLAAPSVATAILFLTKYGKVAEYYISGLQSDVVLTTGSVKTQLIKMAALTVYIVVLLALTIVVFERKEVK